MGTENRSLKHEITYLLIRSLFGALSILPSLARRAFFTLLFRAFFVLHSGYRSVIVKNLSQVFPERDEEWKREFLKRHAASLARLLDDLFIDVTPQWVEKHVRFDRQAEFGSEGGALFFTGHLGSFELLARIVPLVGGKTGFVVRGFPNKRLDDWWQGKRGENGNLVIERNGALRKMIRGIQGGYKLGVLFDQNVTSKHAVFVDHFGRAAATSFAPAHVALHTKCSVYVITIRPDGRDNHIIDLSEVSVQDLYDNPSLSRDDKIRILTERATREFESRILQYPEGWFWLHRRWKTTPEGIPEDFYD